MATAPADCACALRPMAMPSAWLAFALVPMEIVFETGVPTAPTPLPLKVPRAMLLSPTTSRPAFAPIALFALPLTT